MSLLITNIGQLVTNNPAAGPSVDGVPLGILDNAAVVFEGDKVGWVGLASEAPAADESVDAEGKAAIPGFVDSHSHLVFAGDRANEFAARMTGKPYGVGGIQATVAATRAASDTELRATITTLAAEMRAQGTTTFETKSGYGLTTGDEQRSLAIAQDFTPHTTFLGAHVVPPASDVATYVETVTGPMLRACAPYAQWIDVFCEEGAFDVDQARVILNAGARHGLAGRLHANQLTYGGGIQLAAELGLLAVDHCTYLTPADIQALVDAGTIATLLPGVEFCTRLPYPNARGLLDAGVKVALASDCNPGSCFTTSLPLCIALAVRELGMSPAEALFASTATGAAALARTDIGSLAVGQRADLAILAAPSYLYLAYRPGVPLVARVWLGGVEH
jgi:imidazolonepropionase